MNYQVAGHQTDQYRITTEVYEGPLDLLLELIQKAELDITKLALAQVTDQYLAYLHHLTDQDAAQVSAFLVIAAKLLQIKSEALLPRPVEREAGEEDPGEMLAQQLLTYRMYKQAAEWLSQRDLAHLHTYLRLASPPRFESKPDLSDITLQDLVNAARSIFNFRPEVPLVSEVVALPTITIREKIQLVMALLHRKSETTFHELLAEKKSKLEVVITFLAVLELIKRKIIFAQQEGLFSEIDIKLLEELNSTEDLDLEFGE
jgi:segregation and condensation protein A